MSHRKVRDDMTREEAISILIREKDEDPFMRTEYRNKIHEALNMAIKALEQETVLDKIRAEIDKEADYYDAEVNLDIAQGLYMAVEIIDKHMGRDKK